MTESNAVKNPKRNHRAYNYYWASSFRACSHGGGGPQVGEVTPLRWGNPPVHSRLPHLPGFPHFHVNRSLKLISDREIQVNQSKFGELAPPPCYMMLN